MQLRYAQLKIEEQKSNSSLCYPLLQRLGPISQHEFLYLARRGLRKFAENYGLWAFEMGQMTAAEVNNLLLSN